MPVYNSELFLRQSITSVLSQTLHDLELILVNDGSTDGSLNICREYAATDDRIIIIDKTNEGSGLARNAGIDVSSGKYLVFPDSDDWLELNAYERCIQKIEECSADLLVFGMQTEVFDNASGQFLEKIPDQMPSLYFNTQKSCRENWWSLYRQIDMGSPANKVYRGALIRDNQIRYPDLRRMQDGVFNARYFNYISSVIAFPQNFYHRRWHSSAYQKKKMPKDFIECAIFHHKTITSFMNSWGVLGDNEYCQLGEAFSETIMMAAFVYIPEEKPTFFTLYWHIRSILSHPYIHDFYKKYKKRKGKVRKKELAMLYKWDFLLSIDAYLRNKRHKG